jgi:hypothetical protein
MKNDVRRECGGAWLEKRMYGSFDGLGLDMIVTLKLFRKPNEEVTTLIGVR